MAHILAIMYVTLKAMSRTLLIPVAIVVVDFRVIAAAKTQCAVPHARETLQRYIITRTLATRVLVDRRAQPV